MNHCEAHSCALDTGKNDRLGESVSRTEFSGRLASVLAIHSIVFHASEQLSHTPHLFG